MNGGEQEVNVEMWNILNTPDMLHVSLRQIEVADAMFVQFHPKDIYEHHDVI